MKKNSIKALKKIMKFLDKNNLKVLKSGGDGEITFNRSPNYKCIL